MELVEAIEKAVADVDDETMLLTNDGINIVRADQDPDKAYEGCLSSLVGRCGRTVGNKVIERYGPSLMVPTITEETTESISRLLLAESTKMCHLGFAMGYVLGSPEWDRREHNKETYVDAFKKTERGVLSALMERFKSEPSLERFFFERINAANCMIVAIYARMDVPRSAKTIHSWSSDTCSFAMYDSFLIGLRVRQLMEEHVAREEERLTFEQITQQFEE